jgi:hypothetical protein
MYYATYTAYDGRAILPQLIETEDFLSFRILTLSGGGVRNKGMVNRLSAQRYRDPPLHRADEAMCAERVVKKDENQGNRSVFKS